MRIITQTVIAFVVVFGSIDAFAISITYDGFACKDPVITELNINATPTSIPLQSRFEVIDDLGGGVYKLKLTGGLPRIINDNAEVCVHSDAAIGYYGDPSDGVSGLMPIRLKSVNAIGYFANGQLIITVNAIYDNLAGVIDTTKRLVKSSNFSILSNTLIFDYNHEAASFKLKKILQNVGSVFAFGFYADQNYGEVVNPTARQTVIIPSGTLEYFLE
jgi:hypothetical protein